MTFVPESISLQSNQCLSQGLENGCPKSAIGKFWGFLFLKGIPQCIQIANLKHVFTYLEKAKCADAMSYKVHRGKNIQLFV